MRPSKYKIGRSLDPSLLERVEKVFEGENLVETILHAHLLIERALTARIAEKLARPDILRDGQWSFRHKLSLYIGLVNPAEWHVRQLRGFNRLRNVIAHNLDEDPAVAVANCLPWERERETDPDPGRPSDPVTQVQIIAGMLLLFELGGIAGISVEPQDWEKVDPFTETDSEA